MIAITFATMLIFTAGMTEFQQVDFTSGEHRLVAIAHGEKAASAGSPDVRTAALPTTAPSLPARGSKFSTLFRARDVIDLANSPARAVAKLFRMTVDNTRSGTACTAQFIGPRHLLTAGHCIVNRINGVPHPGFEVATRFDVGQSPDGTALRAVRAWVPADQWLLSNPLDALVTPEKCSDYAVIEVERAAPAEVGWLAMSAVPAAGLLHRFSYPHRSAAEVHAPPPEGASASDLELIAKELEQTVRREAEFSPNNLYYEYGSPDAKENSHFAERNGYTLPGRSGSALIDSSGAIVALRSRTYDGTTYSCRLTPAEIGAITAIMEVGANAVGRDVSARRQNINRGPDSR